jgi:ribosomal-protein-alanine N-acetyltransferase
MNYPNEEISLRPWKEEDRKALIAYANNKKIFNNLTDAFPHPFTDAAATKFLAWANKNRPPLILAITTADEVVGSIGLHPLEDVFRLNCELGYWIAEPFWGKGIATEAVKQMARYAQENFHFKRLFARPYGRNIASQKVLEKAGFTLEAHIEQNIIKNHQLEDELIYALRF